MELLEGNVFILTNSRIPIEKLSKLLNKRFPRRKVSSRIRTSHRGHVHPYRKGERAKRSESCEDHPNFRSLLFQQNSGRIAPTKVSDKNIAELPLLLRSTSGR